jgi:SAM-dependent MidA family methyltransferase
MANALPEVQSLILRNGAISFSTFMETALYHSSVGFYENDGAAGRRGDFITSPEVGPLFGVLISRMLDEYWEQLGKPDPFFVFDVGAGRGTLARSVLKASPNCTYALRYVLVDRSSRQRASHHEYLSLDNPAEVFTSNNFISATGPMVISVSELPSIHVNGVVIANELFDNIPFDIAEFHAGSWKEAFLTTHNGQFMWSHGPINKIISEFLNSIEAPEEGTFVPLFRNAQEVLQSLLDVLESGFVVAIDYGTATTAELATRSPEWLRTYREHERGVDPLADIGERDITADIAFDQLTHIAAPNSMTTQAAFLKKLGIDELISEGKEIWNERAQIGDLRSIQARSRISEAKALIDPNSLGAFIVTEWGK